MVAHGNSCYGAWSVLEMTLGRAPYQWPWYKALHLRPGIGLHRLHSISFPCLVVDIVGDCGSLSLSFWVWACNWLAAVGHQSELRDYPLSPSVPLLATERSVSSLWSTPNTFTMLWIQLHKLWAGKETVLALRVFQQHTVLLHKCLPHVQADFLHFLCFGAVLSWPRVKSLVFLLKISHPLLAVGHWASCFPFLDPGCPKHRTGV